MDKLNSIDPRLAGIDRQLVALLGGASATREELVQLAGRPTAEGFCTHLSVCSPKL
jgi:hypothetical protein